ncbi:MULTISPECIES: DNA/RNA nuclease SfsA [Gammaproteobacteria]|uniref:DNA/RNA nuclease SfsA n=1 Tax=Gammaproteobacteria TaxID=1236 RepID=UPI000DD08134|nr:MULTISPECIES: DNA/RNA nuclease SfsA [Gammaproteobacteria]RTE85641.1 DNA/RNA nuclease SfsA [Aliidiomarina sp. B3213]TCZ89610.1 DNA/RNA nuclease SfsA [Lysobacter sp. N42]
MQFNPPLKAAKLVKRYKRFLADVTLPDGSELTVHCPNTGAMTGCAIPDSEVWLSESDNKKRKYAHTWEVAKLPSKDWVCINTHRANELVVEALHTSLPKELESFSAMEREVKYGEKSRCDIVLQRNNAPDTYIEVKSVTLLEDENGYFPDAVSTRATRQIEELIQLKHDTGNDIAIVYAVMHTGIKNVQTATHIDPNYAAMCKQAEANGLTIFKAFFNINQYGIEFSNWSA